MVCNGCGRSWDVHEEKMTDVRIATELLMDAHADRFDVALLVSGDSDLVPPIQAIHQQFPQKKVVVCFPPKRHSVHLAESSKGSFQIGRAKLAAAQLPDTVVTAKGYKLVCPAKWIAQKPESSSEN